MQLCSLKPGVDEGIEVIDGVRKAMVNKLALVDGLRLEVKLLLSILSVCLIVYPAKGIGVHGDAAKSSEPTSFLLRESISRGEPGRGGLADLVPVIFTGLFVNQNHFQSLEVEMIPIHKKSRGKI